MSKFYFFEFDDFGLFSLKLSIFKFVKLQKKRRNAEKRIFSPSISQNRYGYCMAMTPYFDIIRNQTALPFLSEVIAGFPYAQFSLWLRQRKTY